jgi:hypothetical protein
MRMRRLALLTVAAALVALGSSCGTDGRNGSRTVGPDSSVDFSGCLFPTLPGGTWVDTEGNVHDPRTAPTPRPVPTPEAGPPTSGGEEVPAADLDVADPARAAAIRAATSDPIVGSLLSDENATLTSATHWLDQHEQPIGVILGYSFEEPVDLPRGHGEIVLAANPDSGTQGEYEPDGLPTKAGIGSSATWPGTESAQVFVDAETSSVYAVQPMTDTLRHRC